MADGLGDWVPLRVGASDRDGDCVALGVAASVAVEDTLGEVLCDTVGEIV